MLVYSGNALSSPKVGNRDSIQKQREANNTQIKHEKDHLAIYKRGRGRVWTRDLWILSPAPYPLGPAASPKEGRKVPRSSSM